MSEENSPIKFVLERQHFQQLLDALLRRGFQILGPTVRDAAIVYDRIQHERELPIGYGDHQDGGTYRLIKRNDAALFGYAVGPHSWKRFLHVPVLTLFRAERNENGFNIQPNNEPVPKCAFLGVRACELHAIAIQDKVFLSPPHIDTAYQHRREQSFIVALNCSTAGGTCFCVSMKTGPCASSGFDLALTEVIESRRHYFLVQTGSQAGIDVLSELKPRAATSEEVLAAENVVKRTESQMGRELDTTGIKELLAANLEHPRWEQVAARCETCTNCTMVCPTCFCTTVEDVSDLNGQSAERRRVWDSCFNQNFSYMHGGSVRQSTKSRYRQWLTHKLGTWFDQFGTSGCVGCGRCITWCPVGIDITEEVKALRESAPQSGEQHNGNA